MGEIKRGILGGFSGKVGTVVGANWKRISYMRALAVSVSNPRTLRQRIQRGKFKLCLEFLKPMTGYLNESFQYKGTNRTAYNAAMSQLLRNAVKSDGMEVYLDYNRALVASGNLLTPQDAAVEVSGNKLTFSWEDNSELGNAAATDVAMPLVINKESGEVIYDLQAATRADMKAELEIPDSWDGQALAVYLAFRNEAGTRVSNSRCLKNDDYEGTEDTGNGGESSGGGGSDSGGSDVDNPLG